MPGLACAAEPGDYHHSPEAFAFVERCKDICKRKHLVCQLENTERVLPPRLIRVDEYRLVLIDSVALPKDSTYVALSYCWGNGMSLCTTKKTMASIRKGIPLESLPPVLLDAAEVTKKLGEKYIWIDRLCIQQDNAIDWQENASIMARIFEQAELTIGAVSSASVDESFLRPLNEEHRNGRSSLAVQWPDTCRDRFRDIRVRVRSKALDISYTDDMKPHLEPLQDVYPLDTRGWTYQERYLSRRNIRYLPHQIAWECYTAQYLEKYPFDTLDPAPRDEWQQSVQNFTRRLLTFATDRPAAISGVASKNWWRGEPYVAGHWDNGAFISQLRWSPELRLGANFCDEHALSGAPSWSWLSVTHPIVWRMGEDNDLEFISEIHIVEIYVEPSGPDPFGAFVTPGKLVLRARLLDARLRCQQQAQKSHLPPVYECIVHRNGVAHPVAGVSVDTHLEIVAADGMTRWTRQCTKDASYLRPGTIASVKLFPIEVTRDEFNSFALILSPIPGVLDGSMPMYERVGHVSIDRYERKRRGGVDRGDEFMQEALAKSEHEVFCIV